MKKTALCLVLLLAILTAGCGASAEDIYKSMFVPELPPETAADPAELLYGTFDIDHIIVTNASRTIEPRELREGEEFLGLILESIYHSSITLEHGEIIFGTAAATFVGEIVVTGYLTQREIKHFNPFIVHEEYHDIFPQVFTDGRALWFHVDDDVLLEAFGVDQVEDLFTGETVYLTEPWDFETQGIELTLRIDSYTIVFFDAGVANLANVVEIIGAARRPCPGQLLLSENIHVAEAFLAVLNDELPFTYFTYRHVGHMDALTSRDLAWMPLFDRPIYFYDYLNTPAKIYAFDKSRFTIIDMDGNGVPELVLVSGGDTDVLVLRYVGDGMVFGWGFPFRQFQSLKADGTFHQLSWMQDVGSITRLNFTGFGAQTALELEFVYLWEQRWSEEYQKYGLYLNDELQDAEVNQLIISHIGYFQYGKESAFWHPFSDFVEVISR